MRSSAAPPGPPGGRPDPENPFWALTTYFNPAQWKGKLRNYRTFRRHLGLPLLTVELGFGGRHELASEDADLLVRPAEGDVMWQKERLLNVGLAALPSHVTHVAWLDCDLVFERADWWRDALAALRRDAAVQVFERIVSLGPRAELHERAGALVTDSPPLFDRELAIALWLRAHPARIRAGARFPSRRHRNEVSHVAAPGCGWAASRETLERIGLLDTLVLGGGDAAIVAGFLGEGEEYLRGLPEYRRRGLGAGFEPWAESARAATGGRVGATPGRVYHLWHGDFEHRGYDDRHRILAEHDFRPELDLRRGAGGAWLWATPKRELHRRVEAYFVSRREDGREAESEWLASVERRSALALGLG